MRPQVYKDDPDYIPLDTKYKSLILKYSKLSDAHTELVERVTIAEKGIQVAENKGKILEEELRIVTGKLQQNKQEIRNALEVEYTNRNIGLTKNISRIEVELLKQVEESKKTIIENENLQEQIIDIVGKNQKRSTEITTMENKINTLIGKVTSAKNRIVSLNASTPYRPGAVERTLRDVLEDLKNV